MEITHFQQQKNPLPCPHIESLFKQSVLKALIEVTTSTNCQTWKSRIVLKSELKKIIILFYYNSYFFLAYLKPLTTVFVHPVEFFVFVLKRHCWRYCLFLLHIIITIYLNFKLYRAQPQQHISPVVSFSILLRKQLLFCLQILSRCICRQLRCRNLKRSRIPLTERTKIAIIIYETNSITASEVMFRLTKMQATKLAFEKLVTQILANLNVDRPLL